MSPRTTQNEADRLAALREYHILDTDAEDVYDDITLLAASICDVPIALISLVDESRQWFKARTGLDESGTSRDAAFCAQAILQTEPLVVRNTFKDQRFVHNELVEGLPHIQFYAGYPLINPEGFALGTLCVIDRKPRRLTSSQHQLMLALSRQVMALLEARRVSSRLAAALENIKELHGLLPICAWCKRVRDDRGYWGQLENYLKQHTSTELTHSICPDCMELVRNGLPQPDQAADHPPTSHATQTE